MAEKIHGGVKVSTGILKYAKRAGMQAAFIGLQLKYKR